MVPSPGSSAYPRDREAEIALRDGSTVHVRPVRPEDREAIRSFLEGVSRESIGFRFFGQPSLEWATNWSLDVDYATRFALVAVAGIEPQIIAHAAYVRGESDCAEVAFLVADAWQAKGIATVLLAHLAEVAERHGITRFTAEVLPGNHRMIDVFRESGFPVAMHSTPDAIAVEFPTSLSDEARRRFHDRERDASVAAVRSVLEPRSVAVIGASRDRRSIGGEVLHNLLTSDFQGLVYAVNPNADIVQCLPSYRSVLDIPGSVDMAAVAVPAAYVPGVARECAQAGVRALVVISAGFSEVGPEGAALQRELLEVCRASGMRLVGPNCLGVINTSPQVKLNATFAPSAAQPGRVAFMSQSGGLGIAVIEAAGGLGTGLSSFVSVGNKADVSGNDFLTFWEEDPGTDVVLMYLESFGNPRRFARIAPRLARRKPLLAVKSGRSSAGARATSSHTGALLAASDATVGALFEQAGVIRTDTLHELFNVGALLAAQPVPKGDRVAIVTNAGGPGILCADACQAEGVEVPEPASDLQAELARLLPPASSLRNPIDMVASASAEDYTNTIVTLLEADAYDAVLAIFVPTLAADAAEVATAIRVAAERFPAVPVAAVFMTGERPPADLRVGGTNVPGYEFPEDAARALALAAKHGRWRARPAGTHPLLGGIDSDRAAAIISHQLGEDGAWMPAAAVTALLGCYGLPVVPTRVVADAEAAVDAAAELGWPVVLKAIARGLVHKSDVGGVALGLEDPDDVRTAAGRISRALTEAGLELDGLLLQPMAAPGVELIAGVVSDPSFGPVLACGAGGTAAELIQDVAVRITPITDLDAGEMLRSLRTFPALNGYRGAARCDIGAIEDVLLRLSALVDAHPEIVELDLNPLVARPDGVRILDARVRVQRVEPSPPSPSLAAR